MLSRSSHHRLIRLTRCAALLLCGASPAVHAATAIVPTDTASITVLRSVFEVQSGAKGIHGADVQAATIADCRFLLQPGFDGVRGLLLEADSVAGDASFRVDRNEFLCLGDGTAIGMSLIPGDDATLVATNNELRDLRTAIRGWALSTSVNDLLEDPLYISDTDLRLRPDSPALGTGGLWVFAVAVVGAALIALRR